jgi:hypothetical protein
MIKQLKQKVKHKLSFWKTNNFKKILKEYGVPLLVIFVVWEIIEDVLFPALFYWLGQYFPAFYALIPVSWLLCLHPLAVPILWWIYIKFWGVTGQKKYECEHEDDSSRQT